MKKLFIGLMALGSLSALASSANDTIKKLSGACTNKEFKLLLGEKIDKCQVELKNKVPLETSILCTGKIDRSTDCKVTLIDGVLKTKCNTSERNVFYNDSEAVQVDYFQPTFELRGKENSVGFYKRLKLERGNETVITAQSAISNLIVFHEGPIELLKNKISASVKVKTVSGLKELKDLACYIID